MRTRYEEVIGLIPAAGKASRLAPLPCSKELFPLGFRSVGSKGGLRPKVAAHFLLEKMRLAGVGKAYVVLRKGKWDIPAYFGDGRMLDMKLAYLVAQSPFGVPYTLDEAFPFVERSLVALGFPDMVLEPEDAFVQLLAKREATGADLVLGLFPAWQPRKTDMVNLDESGRVCSIEIKPKTTDLTYAWEVAVWTPGFTRFMHDFVSSDSRKRDLETGTGPARFAEVQVSEVVQAAINDGLHVESVVFEHGRCLDIGTPEDLVRAVRAQTEKPVDSR